jgi:hypothetical protein
MAYSKAKLKSNGDKASPCFRPFWIGNVRYINIPNEWLYTAARASVPPQFQLN